MKDSLIGCCCLPCLCKRNVQIQQGVLSGGEHLYIPGLFLSPVRPHDLTQPKAVLRFRRSFLACLALAGRCNLDAARAADAPMHTKALEAALSADAYTQIGVTHVILRSILWSWLRLGIILGARRRVEAFIGVWHFSTGAPDCVKWVVVSMHRTITA